MPFKSKYVAFMPRVAELHANGLRNGAIAADIGIDSRRVSDLLKKLGLQANEDPEIVPTYEQEQILIGGILGDMCVFKDKAAKYHRMNLGHSLKQKQYLEWKYSFISDFFSAPHYTGYDDPRNNRFYEAMRIQSLTNKYFTRLHHEWYRGKQKYIDNNIEKLDAMGLAVFFYDDGYSASSGGYYISTDDFLLEDIEKIAEFLYRKFNVKCNIHQEKKLYIMKGSAGTFEEIVRPFATPDLLYKFHGEAK